MAQIFSNYSRSKLASSIDDTQTTITVTTGDGALFPSPSGGDYALVTVEDPITRFTEIMQLTARSGDTLTVVRGQENTPATAFSVDARVEVRVTAGTLDNLVQEAELTQAEANAQAYTDTHEARTDNPHQVTAAQAGALPLAGGTMSGALDMGGNDITNIGALGGTFAGRLLNVQVFKTSGTYTPTAGVTKVTVIGVAGGGGGGGCGSTGNTANMASGGSGGGSFVKYLLDVTAPGYSAAITVGAGGAGGTGGGDGANGNNTRYNDGTFDQEVEGGRGGIAYSSSGTSPASVIGVNGGSGIAISNNSDLNINGAGSSAGIRLSSTTAIGGNGGGSFFGGGGRGGAVNATSMGSAGEYSRSPGAGGGGAAGTGFRTTNGGIGNGGVVVILEYS